MEQIDTDSGHASDEVFSQVTHVLAQAFGTVASEVRLELDSEVSETLRHEFSQHSWTDRLAGLDGCVTFHFDNLELKSISGIVVNASQTHAEVLTDSETFIIWLEQVTLAENLSRKISPGSRSVMSTDLNLHWLHDMCDSQTLITVWCGYSRRVVGKVIAVGHDYLELLVNENRLVLNARFIQGASAPLYGVAL